jgi:deoxyribodipyrimidine photo-lyase
MAMSTALVLLQRDLRLADNPAWSAACAQHAQVLPVFILVDGDGPRSDGAASRWWLHHALGTLERGLREAGAGLHPRRGKPLQILRALIARSGASAVYWNRCYEPALIARDKHIKSALQDGGIAMHSHNAALWREPWQIATLQGKPYRVFTPYCRRRHARAVPHRLDAQPRTRDRGQLPDQKPAPALAARRALVLGHPGRCGPGQQFAGLAVDGRLRRGCRTVLPRVQSGDAGEAV